MITGKEARRRGATRSEIGSRCRAQRRRLAPSGGQHVETDMLVRLVLGLGIIVICLAVALRRIVFLTRLITSGQPAPGRLTDLPDRIKAQVVEVFGQKRLLKWSVPGVAHFFTFWAFVILFATIVEAVGALFSRDFAFPIIGHWRILGFAEDLIGTLLLLSLLTFAIIRRRNSPKKVERASRFYGS